MVRCFVAIYPVKSKRVYEMQEKIGKLIEGKEVEKENMHITLSFLGEKTEGEIEEIKERLKEVVSLCYKRVATLTKIKFIPNERFLRVIAIDVVGLEDLSEMVEKKVGGDAKPPHLTLFRVKNVKNRRELLEFKKVEINENVPVERICLMKSTLTRKGPIYEVISSFELKSY
jgi:2'-5' RNA ligase